MLSKLPDRLDFLGQSHRFLPNCRSYFSAITVGIGAVFGWSFSSRREDVSSYGSARNVL
jgi:hypothetical protein